MNEIDLNRMNAGEEVEFDMSDGSSSIHGRPPAASFMERLGELEVENARLHRLVAELLIKNQQLRTSH
jgi:ferric-dicitrate binding protein FerR (iron transport regulator)